MVRRFQLMDPEPRTGVARAVERLREGLLRDNKVIAPVLGVLALIILAWIVAGALIRGPGDEVRRQVPNPNNQQVAQYPNEDGGSGTPAPGVENRDADSFAAFESKDPFRPLIPPADEGNGETTASETTASETTASETTDGGTGDGGAGSGQYGGGSGGGSGGEDFMDQTFPGDPGFGDGGGAGGDQYGGGSGGDDLFDSGGELGP